jgi:outer membrane protein
MLAACGLRAEVRNMTLRQAVQTALQHSPDITMARLDEEKATQAVRLAKDPFSPRIVVGSGLAYTNGFPMSIEGSAPSIVQANAAQYIFNRPQNYAIAQAKENVRSAGFGTAGRREDVAFRVATLYLDAERAARVAGMARKELESLDRLAQTVQAQVQEGRDLPIAAKRAQFNLARARQVVEGLEADQATAETTLAVAAGFPAEDRVRAMAEDRALPALPSSEDDAIVSALESNKDLRRLESQIVARGLEMKGAKAQRLPRVDLVAQYAMMAEYNNYQDYFRKFQRNNGQLGVSFQLPLLTGPGVGASLAQTQVEVSKLKTELGSTRNRISSDLQQSFREVRKAESAAEVARLDLELAREQLSVNLAQLGEGRLPLRQVEEARVAENDKWIAFYDAHYAVERARWNVLRLTGDLLAAVQTLPGGEARP